jgi:cell shape-determining protein MreC
MKMNYLPRNRHNRPYLMRVIVLSMILILGVALFSVFNAVIISIISPVWKMENSVIRNFSKSIAFFNSQKALVEENAILKTKLSSRELEILSLSKDRISENTLLELVGRKQTSSMIAAVLTHPPQSPYDVIVIDVGLNKSIARGSNVFLPEGPVLGVVTEVFSKSAKVKLFSAPGEETNAILERNNVPVTLIGKGGGNFELTLPRNIVVEKGDRILSPSITSHLLAVVGEVSIQSTDSFQEILASSPTNVFTLRFVSVTP